MEKSPGLYRILPKILFYLSILVIMFSFFLSPPKSFSSANQFKEYMGLLMAVLSTVITLTVFLVQSSTQNYSSQLIRFTFLKDKLFLSIIGYSLGALIFFIYGISFNISLKIQFVGFFISLGLILNFIAIILNSVYYMNTINIIKQIEEDIIKWMKSEMKEKTLIQIGKISITEASLKKIYAKINPLFDTLKRSIKMSQDDISNQCLTSIESIIKNYLIITKEFNAVEDKFLAKINDECDFLIDTVIEAKNQKIMKGIAIFIGNIAEYALTYRKKIGFTNNYATPFAFLLSKLFKESYPFSRTEATGNSIKQISRIIKKSIDLELHQSIIIYLGYLEIMSKECLLKQNQFWSANLLTIIINEYKNIIGHIITSQSTGKGVLVGTIDTIFRKITQIILLTSQSYRWENFTIIIANVFGLESILTVSVKTHPLLPTYKKIGRDFFREVITNYSKMYSTLTRTQAMRIDFQFLNGIIEFAFVTEYLNEHKIDCLKDHQEIFENLITRWIDDQKNTANDSSADWIDFEKTIGSYFAILIKKSDLGLCDNQLNILAKKYTLEKDKIIKKKIYNILKIIGAMFTNEPVFSDLQIKITNLILMDFKEYKQTGRSIPYHLEMYDYQNLNISNEWFITPLTIWDRLWQDEINQHFSDKRFIKYHEILKKAHPN